LDGVEQQKNIVCGATTFSLPGTPVHSLLALVKIVITGNGQNCELIGRCNDGDAGEGQAGQFVKFIMSNILEIIALKVN